MRHIDRLKRLSIFESAVVLMDRGYFSRELCEFLSYNDLFYVFRLKNNLNFLKKFKGCKCRTMVIDLNEGKKDEPELLSVFFDSS